MQILSKTSKVNRDFGWLIWAFLVLGFVGISFSCYGLGVVSIEGFFFVSGVF